MDNNKENEYCNSNIVSNAIKEINTEYQVVRIKPMKGLFDED